MHINPAVLAHGPALITTEGDGGAQGQDQRPDLGPDSPSARPPANGPLVRAGDAQHLTHRSHLGLPTDLFEHLSAARTPQAVEALLTHNLKYDDINIVESTQ